VLASTVAIARTDNALPVRQPRLVIARRALVPHTQWSRFGRVPVEHNDQFFYAEGCCFSLSEIPVVLQIDSRQGMAANIGQT